MSQQSIYLNPNWRVRMLHGPAADEDRRVAYDKVHDHVIAAAAAGTSPGAALLLPAEEIARALVVHGPDQAELLREVCRGHLAVAAVREARAGAASAEALLGLLSYHHAQLVVDVVHDDVVARQLAAERLWLEMLADRVVELDRIGARRALVIAVAARAFELVPRFVRLRNTATVLVEHPDDPDTYLRLIATYPDTPLTWIELLYIARAYRQHAQGLGPRAIGTTARWLHQAVLHLRWPDPEPPLPQAPPPLWTRPQVQRALHLFAPPPPMPIPNSGWTRIECWGLHGLWGGNAIRIACDGTVVVESGRSALRYQAVMSSVGLAELDWLLGEVDLAAIADSMGSVVPDTMSFELALDTPRGRTVARRWASDSHEGFDALREWLTLAAEAAIATHAPSGSRAPDAWLPPSHESRAARVPEPAPMPRVGGLTLGDVLPLSQRLTGSASPTTTAIGPAGPQLRVFSHVVPAATPVRCVSLVTDGLRRLGRDELILTVPEQILTPDAEHVPATLLKLIAAGLEQGPRLGPGAIIKARTASLPGWSRVSGFALERAWPMDNVTLPPGCLSLHALVGQELAAVDRFGTLRVLARLGLANRFYPTPPWCDPARATVAAPEESTILASVATAHFPGVTVTREAPWIVLRVARSTQPALAADVGSLDPAAPLALFTSLHLDADACLAWRSGQTAAETNTRGTSPASRLAGCFVLFRPGQAVDGGNLLEDGFAVTLTRASAARLRAALVAGAPLDVRSTQPGVSGLRLEWTGELA